MADQQLVAGPSRRTVKSARRPTRCTVCLAAWCVALVLAVQPAMAADGTKAPAGASTVQLVQEPSQTHAKSKISLDNNLPLQLAVVVGSVVVAAICIGSLAWLVCSRRKRQGKGTLGGGIIGFARPTRRTGTQRHSFDPSKPGSMYDFGEADSIDGLSLKEKSDVSSDHQHPSAANNAFRKTGNRASFLSPVSPMPALKIDDTQAGSTMRNPTLVTELPSLASSHRSSGWQLRDGKDRDVDGLDIEANGSLPRRPSFIERLMTHRSMTTTTATRSTDDASNGEMNDTALSDPAPWQMRGRSGGVQGSRMPERSFTTPAALLGGGPMVAPATPVATTGSALLSALGGAFRRVSQHHQHYTTQARRKFVPSPRQMPIESDFEGTIGGDDSDLPMARRSKERRMLESMHSPSVATPAMADVPQVGGGAGGARTFARSPLSGGTAATMQQQQYHRSFNAPGLGALRTPGQHTPGLAGVGTNWPRRMSETAIPVYAASQRNSHRALLSDEKRQQDWQHSMTATMPSKANRKGAKLRNWIAESQFAAVPPPEVASRRGSDISFVISERSMPSVSRQNSIAHLGKQEVVVAMDGLHRVASLNPRFATTTNLASWLEPANAPLPALDEVHADAESQHMRTPKTDYDQARGAMLWEDIPAHDSGSQRTERRSKRSAAAASTASTARPTVKDHVADESWVNEEPVDAEEVARQRAEKQMRKRMRRARRAAKRAARQAALLEANKAVTSLPAVRAALHETGDTTATSDTNKGQEQAVRQRMMDEKHGDGDGSVAWVEELLMNTPQLLDGLHAPVFVRQRTPMVAQRKYTVGGRSTRGERVRHGIHAKRNADVQPAPAARKRPARRAPSPPESPLTSASEYVRSPEVEQHRLRRSSVPTSSVHDATVKARSFLVESRRGSKDTNATSSSSSATNASQRVGTSKSRVVSMPACALTPIADERCEPASSGPRRRLPMPPAGAAFAGSRRPLSAYEQVAQRAAAC